jgi:LuxR family maltose regulon positive regulatory protein
VTGKPPADSSALLQTKLLPPAQKAGLVNRPRLLHRLNAGFENHGGFSRRLTLIAAPAGYGKTTLAGQWVGGLGLSSAWLALESADDDPSRFIRYLIAALRRAIPDVGREAGDVLEVAERPAHEAVLTLLINDLAALSQHVVLALDDYHNIHSADVHQTLGFLLDHAPATFHLLVATREDPPWPVARLQAQGQALVVRQGDLAFTEREAVDFFRALSDFELNPREAAALTRRTEGWVTGLQLAALSMRDAENPSGFIDSFTGSNRFVLDYLLEEVLDRQADDVRNFLLRTSVLDRFCGALCDAVLDREGSREVIETLESSGFFIVPQDQSRGWYRYHRLFADLLLHRLRMDDGSIEADLHRRASGWFEEHGYPSEAVEHALAGEDWERASALVADLYGALLRDGEVAKLLRWCRRLPASAIEENPSLGIAFAWALILVGEVEAGGQILDSVEQATDNGPEFRGEIASAKAFVARTMGDMPRTIELSRQALSWLPPEERGGRANVSMNLGIITWHMGQLGEAEQVLREALADSLATDNAYGAHTAQVFLARTRASQGRLHEAMDGYERALALSDRVPTSALAHHDLAGLLLEWDQLAEAEHHVREALRISRRMGNVEFQIACQIQLALIHLGRGEPSDAESALGAVDGLAAIDAIPSLTRARLTAAQVQAALALGDLDLARRRLETMPAGHDAHPFYRFLELNTARLWLAEGRQDQAADRLANRYELAHNSGWIYGELAVRVLQAQAAQSPEESLSFLGDALTRAEADGYVRLFLSEGPEVVGLLRKAARAGMATAYVESILSTADTDTERPSSLIEPLTDRELEVLRLVAAGLSNQEIATKLTISLGTAKTHTHNLYGKLGVNTRVQAVGRARDLHLI